jgi:hypothetical protein
MHPARERLAADGKARATRIPIRQLPDKELATPPEVSATLRQPAVKSNAFCQRSILLKHPLFWSENTLQCRNTLHLPNESDGGHLWRGKVSLGNPSEDFILRLRRGFFSRINVQELTRAI